MKKYCIDTSGLSTPWQELPVDIHRTVWRQVVTVLESGVVAVTAEIYEEMTHITGSLGDSIKTHKNELLLEVGRGDWGHEKYTANGAGLLKRHHDFISEYSPGGHRDGTVGTKDITIIALAQTLQLPVVSSEKSAMNSTTKRRIPDVCRIEGIEHLTFHEFLRREGIHD